MGESMEKRNDQPDMARRKFLKDTVVGGLAAAGMAAAAPGNADAMAALDWLRGSEKKEDLNDKFHAARKYMAHNGGELEKNLKRLSQEVGVKMLNGDYERLPVKERKSAEQRDMQSIFAERQAILDRFDPELIPELLVLYVQSDLQDKSLVKIYQELGGDISDIKKLGLKGVDEHLVDEIMSEITYSIGSVPGHGNYGLAEYNALSFKKRPTSSLSDVPLPKPRLRK